MVYLSDICLSTRVVSTHLPLVVSRKMSWFICRGLSWNILVKHSYENLTFSELDFRIDVVNLPNENLCDQY